MFLEENHFSLMATNSEGPRTPILRLFAGLTVLNPLSHSIFQGQLHSCNESNACIVEAMGIFTHSTDLSLPDPITWVLNILLLP